MTGDLWASTVNPILSTNGVHHRDVTNRDAHGFLFCISLGCLPRLVGFVYLEPVSYTTAISTHEIIFAGGKSG